MTPLILSHLSVLTQNGQSYLKDPYGLFAGCQSQSRIYSLVGIYCFPDSLVRGSLDQSDQQSCNGPLWEFWHKMHGLDSFGNDLVAYHIKAPSLIPVTDTSDPDLNAFWGQDDFTLVDDLPLMGNYTEKSPDLPGWLKTIDNAVNSQKSNVTPIFEHSQGVFGYNRSRYTWYLHNLLLEEVCDSFPKNDTKTSCDIISYQPVGETKYSFYQSNNTGGANLQALRFNYFYAAGKGSNHMRRTVQLLCCSRRNTENNSLDETFLLDTYSRSTIRVCSPLMCSPALSPMPDFSDTLSTIWTSTLRDLIARMIDRGLRNFDNLPFSRVHEMKYLLGEGLGNRTAKNLVEFFKSRDNSTSSEFLVVETVFDQQIASFPNHFWDIDTFMSIIENTTIKFREATIDSSFVEFHQSQWYDDHDSTIHVVQLFLDALLNSMQVRKENSWNDLAAHSALFSLTETEITDRVSLSECMSVPSELLYGSNCGRATETIQNERGAIKSLPNYDQDYFIDEEREEYVIYVGALVSAVLLIQIFLRYQQLPGGAYYVMDEAHVKRRREQVRMALKDDFLCREREIRARRQLGEERAREALQLLEIAANRDPKLPRDYQTKKRESSRKLVIYCHILLTLSGPFNSLQDYMYMEGIVLCLNMFLSLLEIKASKLLEQPEQVNSDEESSQTKVV